MRINTESRDVLKSAKADGYLHEVLLDRRSKMKSDRMCKWPNRTVYMTMPKFRILIIDVIKYDMLIKSRLKRVEPYFLLCFKSK